MTIRKMSNWMVEKIRKRQDPVKLKSLFNEKFGCKPNKYDLDVNRGQFLCTAIKHNHADLVYLLLCDSSFMSIPFNFPNLALIALNAGNITLVKILLRANISKSWLQHNHEDEDYILRSVQYAHSLVSSVRYACYWNRLDIVSGLMKYYLSNEKYQPGFSSPLGTVISLAKQQFSGEKRFSLSSVVQLMIDEGHQVNNWCGYSPVAILLLQIKFMKSHDIDVAEDIHREVIETLKILLDAGCQMVDNENDFTLSLVKEFASHYSSWNCCTPCTPACTMAVKNHTLLLGALVELHASNTCAWAGPEWTKLIVRLVTTELEFYNVEIASNYVYDASLRFKQINVRVTGYGDIFRLVLMSCSRVTEIWETLMQRQEFVDSLVTIAGYSSRHGHSTKLLRLLLSSLSSTCVNKLKDVLSMRLQSMTDVATDELRTATTNALEWVCREKTPRSLQHLARRAFTGRSLSSVESLEVSRSMRDYLEYK